MLIGLTGKKFSGKTTIAKFLTENYEFKEYAFADSLKEACINIFGLTEEQVYGKNKEIIDEYWNTTPRIIMQTLGTLIRNINFSETNLNNIWIKQVHRKIIASENKNHKDIVVSDIRYNDEALMIKKLGGIIIKIDRQDKKQDDKHESENQEIKLGEVDIIIANDGTIDNLLEKIKQVIDHYNFTIIPL